jgi:Cu(I)/Ag(I) efflux system membrane fusion protein
MKTASAVLSLVVCGALLAPSGRGAAVVAKAEAPAAAKYHCPMHPAYVDDRSGTCPACGMKLVPVAPAATAPGSEGAAAGTPGLAERTPAAAPAAGAMRIAEDKQKVLGMTVAPAVRAAGTRTLRVLGRVAADEARLYKVNAGMAGSVRDVSAATGSRVRKGEVLGTFYAPDAASMLQLFIVNTQGFDRLQLGRLKDDGTPAGEGHGEEEQPGFRQGAGIYRSNLQQRVTQLENLGVSAVQREEIARTGLIPETIKIVSPSDGVVLARGVSPGLKFDRGFEFFRIADLRKVWVLADVFLQDARHVRAGLRAEVSVPEQQVTLAATVTEILPQFDAATRTLKVRLALDNPGFALRPDMFVDVTVRVDLPAGVVVPSGAIVDSGLVKWVYVQAGDGVFEPRAVETGWRAGDQVEVVKGLRPGELVVTSGTFFLDSETRMRPPTSGAASAGEAPALTGQRPPGGAGSPTRAGAGEARSQAPTGPAVGGR